MPCEIGDLIFLPPPPPLGGSYLLKYLGWTLTQVWYYSGGKWLWLWQLIVQVITLFGSSASQMCVKSSPALWIWFRRHESSCWTSAPVRWLNWSQQSSTIQISISRAVNLSKQQAMCASAFAICKQQSADIVLLFIAKAVITSILNALSACKTHVRATLVRRSFFSPPSPSNCSCWNKCNQIVIAGMKRSCLKMHQELTAEASLIPLRLCLSSRAESSTPRP